MADSKRLTTLKALTTFLRTEVSVANGYKHDLDGRVVRGRMFVGRDDPLPLVSILENLDPDRYPRMAGGDYDAPTSKEEWILLLQGWVEDDKVNPTDSAYELMADVRKALAKIRKRGGGPMDDPSNYPNWNLGGLISGMTMEPGIVRPPIEQVSEKAFFWMRVTLKFVEDQNDPYDLN